MSNTQFIPCGATFYLKSTPEYPYRGTYKGPTYATQAEACAQSNQNAYCVDGLSCPAIRQVPVIPSPDSYNQSTGKGFNSCAGNYCPTYTNGQTIQDNATQQLLKSVEGYSGMDSCNIM